MPYPLFMKQALIFGVSGQDCAYLAQLLLDSAKATGGSLKHLRLFMLSGDWLPVELAASILALPQEPRLVSMGASVDELTQACGLTQAEAELMSKMYKG